MTFLQTPRDRAGLLILALGGAVLIAVLLGPLAIAYLFALLHFYREEYGAGGQANGPL